MRYLLLAILEPEEDHYSLLGTFHPTYPYPLCQRTRVNDQGEEELETIATPLSHQTLNTMCWMHRLTAQDPINPEFGYVVSTKDGRISVIKTTCWFKILQRKIKKRFSQPSI